jgi:16S rRNA (guanine966-N2)-methyltransferase
MRVVAGTAKGIKLETPDSDDIRPTADRVRESVFNSLYSLGGVEGWTVVDLFAGTGAMGIEALSRGAERCTFVERSQLGRTLIEVNLERARVGDRARIDRTDAASWTGRADLVIADPPYAFDGWAELLGGLDATWLVLESDRPLEPGERWANVRHKTYGGTVVTFARRAPSPPSGDHG